MFECGKTKKLKNKNNNNHLWEIFDKECNIECIYSSTEVKENNINKDTCQLCSSNFKYTDEGFLTCSNNTCGVINKNILDSSAEWRYYGADDSNGNDPARCGLPINPLLKESSYGCKVLCESRTSYEMRKIRRYTEWQSMPYKEKSQYDEFQRIIILGQNAGLSKLIIDDAMIYHKKISDNRTFRGFNREGIIAATIYVSCRINGCPRTAKEIANIFNLDNSSATKGCKNALSIINELECEHFNNEKTSYCVTTPEAFIERYCSKLSINLELTTVCKFIAKIIEEKNLIPENTPHSIAAGLIYYVSINCNLNISKKNIFHMTEISEVTINKCFKKIESLNINFIPSKILQKYS